MSYEQKLSWDITYGLATATVDVTVPDGYTVEFEGGVVKGPRSCEYEYGERMAFRVKDGAFTSTWINLGVCQTRAGFASSGFALAKGA